MVAALVGAVLVAPIGADLTSDGDVGAEPTPAPVRLTDADQRTLDSGRSAPDVGRASPPVSFVTFDGTPVELHERTRPVVLLFLGAPCTECDSELGRLAVIATILFEDAWVAVLSDSGSSAEVRTGVVEAGATDLLFAGTDTDGSIARSFGIERTPATVVLDGNNRIAAMWQRSIPAGVVVQLGKSLVGSAG